MANTNFDNVAIGDIGTQLFEFDEKQKEFKYAVPVTAGAEFGGDTESFDAPETDLDYVPRVMGRKTLNDISYTINYTKEKYMVLRNLSGDRVTAHTYMEVFSDNSAMIFRGTANEPTITAGDVRQLTYTVIPSFMKWISNIYDLDDEDQKSLDENWFTPAREGTKASLKIDATSVPDSRLGYAVKSNEE